MATAKKRKSTKTAVKASRSKKTYSDVQFDDTSDTNVPVSTFSEESVHSASKYVRRTVLIVTMLAAALIYLTGKGYVVAAVVNGTPIFRWTVIKEMTTRFGQQTLEGMISEQLIRDAAKAKGVTISQADVDTKISQIVTSLGAGVKLDDLLKYQGLTKKDFEKQVTVQMTVEKILSSDVTVSDNEISQYIEKNKETMVATDEAALRGEARETLMSQKINEKIQPWFAELKKNAQVVRLMK